VEAIAESAGIERGTLYRNSRDRSMFVLEIVRGRLDGLVAQVDLIADNRPAFHFFPVRIGQASARARPGRSTFSGRHEQLGWCVDFLAEPQ
jgi:AcrR family transcriptional regulator